MAPDPTEVNNANLQIVEIRPGEFTPGLLADIAALLTRLGHELPGDDPPATIDWAEADQHFGSDLVRHRRLVALHDGSAVGIGDVCLEASANEHVAELQVSVDPLHRRRGIGSAIAAAGLDIADEEQRSSLVAWGTRSAASCGFWDALGLPEVQLDQMSRLDLGTLDQSLMAGWRSESTALAHGYSMRAWISPCPDDLLPAVVIASQGMNDEPMGDLSLEHPTMDVDWQRAREDTYHRRGARVHGMIALAADGSPAALSEIMIFEQRPWFGMQQGTSTLPEHRNKGLGRWIKAAMAERLLSDCPELSVIETGNADDNAPMRKINHEMGFRPHIQLTTRQADCAVVRQALAKRTS